MEEDIKILEELRKDFISLISKKDVFIIEKDKRKKEIRAIKNLINRNRELEEENKKQKQLTKLAQTITDESIKEAIIEFEKDYIPVSLVEEKIEELNKKEKELQNSISDEEREECSDANISFELMDIEIRRSILQELLGEEK